MSFLSLNFAVGFLILVIIYYRLNKDLQNIYLLLMSYLFYAVSGPRFLALLVAQNVIQHVLSNRLFAATTPRARKWIVTASVSADIGLLAFFKYNDFFVQAFAEALGRLGVSIHPATGLILLPLGISFFVFRSVSYTVDLYRGKLEKPATFLEHALYISFFPQIVSGPIDRGPRFLPQLASRRVADPVFVQDGIWLILLGCLKKLVIADQIGRYADLGFAEDAPPLVGLSNFIFVYAYTIQIYADFSGYSDIARGLTKLLGFDVMMNFESPYLVSNPSDFWRQWHISLSSWLRDYLFIPLGGSRGTPQRTYFNLMVTMALGGLWHGAGLAYLLWGVYQGLVLCLYRFIEGNPARGTPPGEPRLTSRAGRMIASAGELAQVVFFFHVTCIGWLIFRVGTLQGFTHQYHLIKNYLYEFLSPATLFSGSVPAGLLLPVVFMGLATLGIQWRFREMERFHSWKESSQIWGIFLVSLSIILLGVFQGGRFIYNQF